MNESSMSESVSEQREGNMLEGVLDMTIDATSMFCLELTDVICKGSSALYDDKRLVEFLGNNDKTSNTAASNETTNEESSSGCSKWSSCSPLSYNPSSSFLEPVEESLEEDDEEDDDDDDKPNLTMASDTSEECSLSLAPTPTKANKRSSSPNTFPNTTEDAVTSKSAANFPVSCALPPVVIEETTKLKPEEGKQEQSVNEQDTAPNTEAPETMASIPEEALATNEFQDCLGETLLRAAQEDPFASDSFHECCMPSSQEETDENKGNSEGELPPEVSADLSEGTIQTVLLAAFQASQELVVREGSSSGPAELPESPDGRGDDAIEKAMGDSSPIRSQK